MTIPSPPLPPRGRLQWWTVGLALAIVAVLGPAIFEFQRQSIVIPPERRSWRMRELDGITLAKATARFGAPVSVRDFSLSEGSFAGPHLGFKHYYAFRSPESAAHLKDAPVVWSFPRYAAIREVVWKLPDSYLTLWLYQPRVEVSLEGGDTVDMTLPDAAPGEWVGLDNYRIGKDLAVLKQAPR